MNDIAEKQRHRAVNDRKTFLINELYKLGIYQTSDGRKIEDVRLFTLEHVFINEKCRIANNIKQLQSCDYE